MSIFKDKTLLITGGTGSFGNAVLRRFLDSVIKVINEVRSKGKEYYSDKCRERAVSCFNKDDRFMDYIDLYRSLR